MSITRIYRSDGTALPLNARRCDTFLCRLRGLTFRSRLAEDEGLLFIEKHEGRLLTAIHMLFVFCDIGVVWINAQGRVVDAKRAKPFRLYYAPREPARCYLEGPPALLDWIEIGETLTFDPPV